MYRHVYDSASAEMFFWNYATKFAVRSRGRPGMAPKRLPNAPTVSAAAAKESRDICLFCGKRGHKSDSGVHQQELAEGSAAYSPHRLQSALSNIAQDNSLNAERKQHWSSRIRGYWSKLRGGGHDAPAS